jgi:hypothetical protein
MLGRRTCGNPLPITKAELEKPRQALSIPEPNPEPASQPEEDLALVHRAQKEDTAAYDELIRRYQERIYATLYHMTSNH